MKTSKETLTAAILKIAEVLDPVSGKKIYEYHLNTVLNKVILPKIVQMLTYDMFLNGADLYGNDCSTEFIDARELIRDYCRELDHKGFVTFDEKV
jgi:hypothetical protein